jgi:hypothetical protein
MKCRRRNSLAEEPVSIDLCDTFGGQGLNVEQKERRGATSGLLQNMSCAPRTQIRHKSPYRRPCGRGILFAYRVGWDPFDVLPGSPGNDPFPRLEDAERELRRRIDAHAQTLALPAAALVTNQMEEEDEICDDLLSIATVLSKSSGRVYLRDKAPNLSQIKPGRRVVLIVPDEGRR